MTTAGEDDHDVQILDSPTPSVGYVEMEPGKICRNCVCHDIPQPCANGTPLDQPGRMLDPIIAEAVSAGPDKSYACINGAFIQVEPQEVDVSAYVNGKPVPIVVTADGTVTLSRTPAEGELIHSRVSPVPAMVREAMVLASIQDTPTVAPSLEHHLARNRMGKMTIMLQDRKDLLLVQQAYAGYFRAAAIAKGMEPYDVERLAEESGVALREVEDLMGLRPPWLDTTLVSMVRLARALKCSPPSITLVPNEKRPDRWWDAATSKGDEQ